ncbi:MAG: radical SAM protein [Polyangiaceae bacterium]
MSGYTWEATETTIKHLKADVVGLSCWTANRRGVKLVSESVKRHQPSAHVTVGGPHATPLPRQLLTHYESVDSVVVGEGEDTFLELLTRIEKRAQLVDLPGAYVRDGSKIVGGAPRTAIENLNTLASPHTSFATHILMTSRGCPWACTFCGAETSWGRGFRPFSVDRVLDDIEAALAQVPVKQLLIKDDTFTTNRNRVLELCRKIRERGLSFLWSCDTRVDVISEELVKEMRLAGCERMSLGVESGAPAILKAINKKITVEQIERSAALLRRYGIKARFYMMLGNRGETEETFRETLAFLDRAKPDQYIFSCLSIYPGTQDYEEAVGRGWLDAETYFTGTFQELKVPFDAKPDVAALLADWFAKNRGLKTGYVPAADELREVSIRLGGAHPPALVELAEALIEEGDLEEAERLLRRALELGYPLPRIVPMPSRCCSDSIVFPY